MLKSSRRFTPLLWFVLAICAFELFIRLPYLVWLANDNYIGYRVQFQYFSVYSPSAVIRDGVFVVLMTAAAALIAHALLQHNPLPRIRRMRLFKLGWQFYAAAGGTVAAALLGVYLLGPSELAESISSKRDLDEIDAGVLLYLLLKVSLFSHVLATLAYMAYLGSGKRYYLILTGIFVLVTMAVSLIFSQRALLFALGFEIIYVTHLYRGLNMRKLLIAAVPFAFVLLAIGAVRAMGTEGGGLGEGALVAIDKLMSSRYFLHIAKVGSVYEWQRVVGEVDLLAFNFLVEPFAPDDTVYFKDIGRIVGMEVFGTPTSGVTLGMVSEYILSFGAAIGSIFVFATLFVVFLAEKTMLQSVRPSLIMFFALAKVPILLNTSLGSFLYQTALETFMLLLVIPGLAFATPRPAGRGSRRVTRKVAPAPRSPSANGRRPVSLRS
jgi:hypothetical protein